MQFKYATLTFYLRHPSEVGLLEVNIRKFVGSTFSYWPTVIRPSSTTPSSFTFSSISSFLEYNSSGSEIIPQVVFRVGWSWTETAKKLISKPFVYVFWLIGWWTSNSNSSGFYFLIERTSSIINWKFLGVKMTTFS